MSGGLVSWFAATLGWLFMHPMQLPGRMHLWMLLPLVVCVAVVYRATRARRPAEMPRPTAITFVNITVGMFLIAGASYAVHMFVKAYF